VQARGIAITPDGARLYVTTFGSNSVKVIDTLSRAVVATVPVASLPIGLDITPDGAFVYVASYLANTVPVINTATNTVVANIAVGGSPQSVQVTPDGTRVFVANSGSGSLSVISTSTNNVVTTISGTPGANALAFTRDGKRAYVTAFFDVKIVDTSSNIVTGSIVFAPLADGHPGAIAITVVGAAAQLTDLTTVVSGLVDVRDGTKTALVAKLTTARDALAIGDVPTACGTTKAFINYVNAQSGEALTISQADELTAEATQIRTVMGCS